MNQVQKKRKQKHLKMRISIFDDNVDIKECAIASADLVSIKTRIKKLVDMIDDAILTDDYDCGDINEKECESSRQGFFQQ